MAESPGKRVYWSIGIFSAAVLAFEISLMRVLLIASWHHFAFIVISIALLGFGASGTILFLLRALVMRHARGTLFWLIVGGAISMPLCTALAQEVPVEARLLPALLWKQLGSWLLFWILLALPFLLAGSAIGLALMMGEGHIPALYGSNLLGSGSGAIGASAAMMLLPPHMLPLACGALAAIAALLLPAPRAVLRTSAIAAAAGAAGFYFWYCPPAIRTDAYKYISYVKRLQSQGATQRVAATYTPRSIVELYRSDTFHDLPFLSPTVAPPPMDALLMDGHSAGSLLRIGSHQQADALDHSLMSFAYDHAPDHPRVLLLGETGGAGIWLAARRQSDPIDVVQPDGGVLEIIRRRPDDEGGAVLKLPAVRVHQTEARHFIGHGPGLYDVIQLVSLEGSAAGSSGMGGLGEDHLVTVEGIDACMKRLSPQGVLFVCRGIQTPPRDNLKLLATFVAALRRQGIPSPQEHLVIVRDYLGVCTMVKKTSWSDEQVQRLRRACEERELTPVWFSGIRAEELNQPDQLPGPAGSTADWYHTAAVELCSARADRFIDGWLFDIRPPTDDRPFFRDFFRLRAIGTLRQAFGELWLTRMELAFLFVLAAMAIVAPVAGVCILLPLAVARLRRKQERPLRGRAAGAVFFLAIGLAYLLLEMTLLSRLTRLVGDPVQTASLTIASFLVLSGAGSLIAQRMRQPSSTVVRSLMLALVALGAAQMLLVGPASAAAGALSLPARCAVAVALIAPVALLMGFPMPLALARLESCEPALIPWTWGANGFASVFAAPLATAISMSWGFTATSLTALLLYGVAAVIFACLPSSAYATAMR